MEGVCEATDCTTGGNTTCGTGLCLASNNTCAACSTSIPCSGATFSDTENQVGTCADTTGVCTFTSTCTMNSDCAASMLCLTTTVDGVATGTCQKACTAATGATDTCTTGTFAAGDTMQVGTCNTTSGMCSYTDTCDPANGNADCVMSNFCDSGTSKCMVCSNDTTTPVSCNGAVFATDTVNQVATCSAAGVCSFSSSCTNNGQCYVSKLCVTSGTGSTATMACAASCTTDAAASTNTCQTGTFTNGDAAQVGTCTTGVCSYSSSCGSTAGAAANALCVASNMCDTGTGNCLATCNLNSQCPSAVNLCTASTGICAASCSQAVTTAGSEAADTCTGGIVGTATADQVGECSAATGGTCVYSSDCTTG